MYRLVDTHAHLEDFSDLDSVISNAKAAGIIAIMAMGSDYASNQKAIQIADRYPGYVFPALGLHPWSMKADELDRILEHIEANADKVKGIGEIGLDYDKRLLANTPKELQHRALRELLGIAVRHRKPVSVHCRYAWPDLLQIIEQAQPEKVVFHWYTGTPEVWKTVEKHGFFVSAGPAVEYHPGHRQGIADASLQRLMLETDTPVVYHRGTEREFKSQPADTNKVLKAISALKQIDEAEIAAATTGNAARFYDLPLKA